MKHLNNILDGIASVVAAGALPKREYVITRDGFIQDRKALDKDVLTLERDFEKASRKYGTQTGSRSGVRQYG